MWSVAKECDTSWQDPIRNLLKKNNNHHNDNTTHTKMCVTVRATKDAHAVRASAGLLPRSERRHRIREGEEEGVVVVSARDHLCLLINPTLSTCRPTRDNGSCTTCGAPQMCRQTLDMTPANVYRVDQLRF